MHKHTTRRTNTYKPDLTIYAVVQYAIHIYHVNTLELKQSYLYQQHTGGCCSNGHRKSTWPKQRMSLWCSFCCSYFW